MVYPVEHKLSVPGYHFKWTTIVKIACIAALLFLL